MRENEARCRDGKAADPVLGCELGTKTVGIVGFGAIGSYTAQLFHGFGCKILAYMPRPKQTPDYVESVSLKELMQRSDIISLHCPMNDSTRGLIGKEQLALAKAGAILINVARGGVVDTQALADALNLSLIHIFWKNSSNGAALLRPAAWWVCLCLRCTSVRCFRIRFW